MFGKPQKALHLYIDEEKKSPKHIGVTYAVLEKFDGWFMYVDYVDGVWGEIKSRAGRTIPSVQHLNVFKEIKPDKNIRVIFEGTIPGMEFKDLNGIFNRNAPTTEKVVFQVHDVVTIEDEDYVTRYLQAKEVVAELDNDLVELVEVLCVSNEKWKWMQIYEDIVSRGGEGVILKEASGVSVCDRGNLRRISVSNLGEQAEVHFSDYDF